METVLITGASSGIGADAALLFSQNGYEVILCGRNSARLEAVQQKLAGPSHVIIGDLAKAQDRARLIEFAYKKAYAGRLTTLVNNAGIYSFLKNTCAVTESDYRSQFEVNFLAPVLLAQELFALLKENAPASVVNISSTLGLRPMAGTNHYSAQKAALINWTECTAPEWAASGVRVNCLCPGLVETPIHTANLNDSQIRKQFDQMQPMGRMGTPRDISEAILFLASNRSSWTTGSVFSVDGGVRLV